MQHVSHRASDNIAQLNLENEKLREALRPFAKLAITKRGIAADDFDVVEVLMVHCRAALKAIAAE